MALKCFIFGVFLAVLLSIQSATSGLIIRQISDFETNITMNGLDNIEAYISITGEDPRYDDPSNGFEQTELMASFGVTKLYTLGKRLPGDSLIGQAEKELNFQTPHNIRIIFTYPTKGVGALVHYVLIAVEQSNFNGRAYVLNGGINQRRITIAVEAYAVTRFYLAANLYGQ